MIKYTISHVICLFILLGAIGIPVIFNHSHNFSFTSQQTLDETAICQEATVCCMTESVAQEKKICCEVKSENNVEPKNNCDCNLLTSCCCCFIDVRLVSFAFEIPINEPINAPSFIQAYMSEMDFNKVLNFKSQMLCYNLNLPPPKTYSQQLALYQVFRI